MLIIHFVEESEDQPCCRHPERPEWLWSADPAAVTCPACAAERQRVPAPLEATRDAREPPRAFPR